MLKPIRHGEIMLVPVEEIPAGKSESHQSYIVGHSETGHHHVLEAERPFEVTEVGDELFFRLRDAGTIRHQKENDRHKDLVIPAGRYQRYTDTEYEPSRMTHYRHVD